MNKQSLIWTLAVANVALAGTLAWRGIKPNVANAQTPPPGVGRAPIEQGKYTMIPGTSQLGVSIIYVLDSANGRLGGFAPNAQNVLDPMPTLALGPIFEAAAAGAGGPQVNPDAPRQTPRPPAPRNR